MGNMQKSKEIKIFFVVKIITIRYNIDVSIESEIKTQEQMKFPHDYGAEYQGSHLDQGGINHEDYVI